MADDNVIIANNGVEIYKSDISLLCDEYISSLPDPSLLYKSQGFAGLLEYIYSNCLRDFIEASRKNRRYDYNVLDNIFDKIYLPLCYRYCMVPTVVQFIALIRIDDSTLTDVRNGVYRTDGTKVNPNHSRIVRKWFKVSEQALLSKTVNDNGVGSLFALKAVYGYRETAPIQDSPAIEAHEAPEQIAARHAAAELPEKPNLNE